MKSMDAEKVAEQLISLFARMGLPREILTDQGSNFTSRLLTEIYRLLHIHPIRTTPYHPQTDGLVERFNKTLKSLLQKAATDTGKDWDLLLPYLLTFCLPTARCPRPPRDSRHLSSSMGERFAVPLTY